MTRLDCTSFWTIIFRSLIYRNRSYRLDGIKNSHTAPCSMCNFPKHQTHMWNGFVGGAEGRGTKKGRGGVREGDWDYETKPKTFGNISPFQCIYRTSTDFWYMYCARKNVGILINAGAKKAFEHFNVILINLCLYLYLGRKASSTFLEKCLNNDRCVNVFWISSTDNSIKQKYFHATKIIYFQK